MVISDPAPGLDVPQSATFIQTLSRFDQLTGNQTYGSQASSTFVAFQKQNPDFSQYVSFYVYKHGLIVSIIECAATV